MYFWSPPTPQRICMSLHDVDVHIVKGPEILALVDAITPIHLVLLPPPSKSRRVRSSLSQLPWCKGSVTTWTSGKFIARQHVDKQPGTLTKIPSDNLEFTTCFTCMFSGGGQKVEIEFGRLNCSEDLETTQNICNK